MFLHKTTTNSKKLLQLNKPKINLVGNQLLKQQTKLIKNITGFFNIILSVMCMSKISHMSYRITVPKLSNSL